MPEHVKQEAAAAEHAQHLEEPGNEGLLPLMVTCLEAVDDARVRNYVVDQLSAGFFCASSGSLTAQKRLKTLALLRKGSVKFYDFVERYLESGAYGVVEKSRWAKNFVTRITEGRLQDA